MNVLCYLPDWECLISLEIVSLMHVVLTSLQSWKIAKVNDFYWFSVDSNVSFYFQGWMSVIVSFVNDYHYCFASFVQCCFTRSWVNSFFWVENFEYQPNICCIYFTIRLPILIIISALHFAVLYSLNIENCSITSRTIQKVADALSAESTLAQLCIGTFNKLVNYDLPSTYLLVGK